MLPERGCAKGWTVGICAISGGGCGSCWMIVAGWGGIWIRQEKWISQCRFQPEFPRSINPYRLLDNPWCFSLRCWKRYLVDVWGTSTVVPILCPGWCRRLGQLFQKVLLLQNQVILWRKSGRRKAGSVVTFIVLYRLSLWESAAEHSFPHLQHSCRNCCVAGRPQMNAAQRCQS